MFGFHTFVRVCLAFLLIVLVRCATFGQRTALRVGVALFVLAFLPLQAFADTVAVAAPADITSSVMDILMTVVTVIVGVILYVVKSAAAKQLGIQITSDAMAAVNTALLHGAHDFISDHLLKGGKITVDLKNAAANRALQYANDHEPEALAHLGLDAATLEQKAQARAGSILNGILIAEQPAATVAAAPSAMIGS